MEFMEYFGQQFRGSKPAAELPSIIQARLWRHAGRAQWLAKVWNLQPGGLHNIALSWLFRWRSLSVRNPGAVLAFEELRAWLRGAGYHLATIDYAEGSAQPTNVIARRIDR